MFKHLKQTILRACVALFAAGALNFAIPSVANAQEARGGGSRR